MKMKKELNPPKYIEKVYSTKGLPVFLSVFSLFTVALTVSAFIIFLIGSFFLDYRAALGVILICGFPFVIVTLLRRRFNAKRPYEIYDLSSLPGFVEKRKSGRSFPSRHVFSAFVIGTTLSFTVPPVGIVLCVFGVGLGACRVLLGIHFIRDVIAGALIGIVSGIVGTLVVNYSLFPVIF